MIIERKIEELTGTIFIEYTSDLRCFKDMEYKYWGISNSVRLFELMNEDFLKENKIEYIKDDKRIIPIGLVNFQRNSNKVNSLPLVVLRREELYKVKDLLDCIEEAIRLKSKYFDFEDMIDGRKTAIIEK